MKTRVVHVNDNVPGAIYIGRAVPRKGLKASVWANPYTIGKDGARAEVINMYKWWLRDMKTDASISFHLELQALAGKPLACWCRHDGEERTEGNACHGDVLIDLIRELGLEQQP